MMLKTSSNKKSPALGMFLFTIRQNIGIIVLTVICMLLICPGFLMIHLDETLEGLNGYSYEFNTVLMIFSVCGSIAGAAGVVVYNIINFMYLYSKKSSDVFHAIPLTRTQLLLSRGLAGLASTLIPLVVGYIALICLTAVYPKLIVDLEILAVGFFYNILIMLIAWSISLIFIICAGTVFDFVLSFGIINVALLLLPLIVSTIADEMLFGFSNRELSILLKWFSPIYFAVYSMEDFINRAVSFKIAEDSVQRYSIFNSNEWIMLGVSLVIIIGLTVLTAWLYNRRKAEKAANAYAFKFIYVITNILLSFEVAYGVGLIFSEFEYNFVFWIFSVAGALLAAVVFGAISERGFKTVKKSILLGGGSIAGLIAIFVILATGGFGYESRIPQIDDIATIEVDISGRYVDLSSDFELVRNLHKNIIDDYDEAIEKSWEKDGDVYCTSIQIEYTLKNGAKMRREYWSLPVDDFGEDIVKICKKEDIQSHITQLNLDKPKHIGFDGNFYDGIEETEDYFSCNIPKEEAIKLLEIYKKENLLMTPEMLSGNRVVNYYLNWDTGYYSSHNYYEFYIGDNYTEFIEAVENIKKKYESPYKEESEKYID
ncbi:MAG: hypothetical protein IKK24_06215 [Clostridia bacterium]|nr:hypothetical protein [Clostridia bacterium]